MSFYLPIDIIFDILSRLPIKTVIRFKLVCKTWYALVEDTNFTNMYGKVNPPITSILITTTQSTRHLYFNSDDRYIPIDFNSNNIRVVGTCSGLVCVVCSFMYPDFIIGNPTTREYRRISPPKYSYIERQDSDIFFFGFSLFDNEYKLLMIIYTPSTSVVGKVVVKAEKYTMSTDSWEDINVKMADHVVNVSRLRLYPSQKMMPVVLDGVFYWVSSWIVDHICVVSFDMFNGFYDEICTPNDLAITNHGYEDYRSNKRLIEFEGKLSLIIDDRENYGFQLWVLNEDKSSWTWKLRIDMENYGYRFLSVEGHAKNSVLLIEHDSESDIKLILYDLNSQEIKSLNRIDVPEANNFYFYTESLRSVKLRKVAEEAA